MGVQSEPHDTFVTDLEELFFEIGKLLAICKTPDQQQKLLDEILTQIEASKEYSNPNESTEDDKTVVKEQLYRHYQKGFARWGLSQLAEKKTIIDVTVANKSGMLSYDEETKQHEKSLLPSNLMSAFRKGLMYQPSDENNDKEMPSKTPSNHS